MFTHGNRTGGEHAGCRGKAGCVPTWGRAAPQGSEPRRRLRDTPPCSSSPSCLAEKEPREEERICRAFGSFLPWLSGVGKVSMEPGMAVALRRYLQFSSKDNSCRVRGCVSWLKAWAMETGGLRLNPSSAWVV